MSRITESFLLETVEQHTLLIQSRVSVQQLPSAIGKGVAALDQYLTERGVIPADTPFVRIDGVEGDQVRIAVGTALPEPLAGSGAVQSHRIPGGIKLCAYWLGDNSQIEVLYRELADVAQQSGYNAQEGLYEYYLNGPEFGEDKLLTKVVMLLEPVANKNAGSEPTK